MTKRVLSSAIFVSLVVACELVATPAWSATASPPKCTLLGIAPTQICPVTFTARAGTSANVVVAHYSDLSHCNISPPPTEPGDNGNYRVGLIRINWGDGTKATQGVAHTSTRCPGTSITSPYGTTETITGTHRYIKPGTYKVSVSITYLRGAGNTYKNCAKLSTSSTVPGINNCIAAGGPITTTATVR